MPRAITLEQLHIPHPCSADWNSMAGDDRMRFCALCQKQVVDLSEHTRSEAEAIVAAALPGGLCAQFRFDDRGRMVTRDAPARRPWWRAGFAASAWAAFVAFVIGCERPVVTAVGLTTTRPTTQSVDFPGAVLIRGDVCVTPTTRPAALGGVRPTPTTVPAEEAPLVPSPGTPGEG